MSFKYISNIQHDLFCDQNVLTSVDSWTTVIDPVLDLSLIWVAEVQVVPSESRDRLRVGYRFSVSSEDVCGGRVCDVAMDGGAGSVNVPVRVFPFKVLDGRTPKVAFLLTFRWGYSCLLTWICNTYPGNGLVATRLHSGFESFFLRELRRVSLVSI